MSRVNKRAASAAAKTAVVLGMRYGPHVYELVKHGKAPVQDAVMARVTKRNAHKHAIEHSRTVIDGSVLKVMHNGSAHYVVFSGDECIATYPPTEATYAELLRHSDLAQRERPGERPARRLRRTED